MTTQVTWYTQRKLSKIQEGDLLPFWKPLNVIISQPFYWFWWNLVPWWALEISNRLATKNLKFWKCKMTWPPSNCKSKNRNISSALVFSFKYGDWQIYMLQCILSWLLGLVLFFCNIPLALMLRCHVHLSVCLWRKCIGALQLIQVPNSDPNLPRIVVAGRGNLNKISRYASHC